MTQTIRDGTLESRWARLQHEHDRRHLGHWQLRCYNRRVTLFPFVAFRVVRPVANPDEQFPIQIGCTIC